MTDPEIENARRIFKGYSRDRLIKVTHEKVAYCAEHVAAKQLLAAMDEQQQRASAEEGLRRHNEAISENRKANKLALFAIVIAFLALLIAAASLALQFAASKASTGATAPSPPIQSASSQPEDTSRLTH